jgi:hypothetical protein
MYLATYKHYYWCDGYTTSTYTITADTLEELRRKAAEAHYAAKFDEDDGDEAEEDTTEKTFGWKVYRLEGGLDIETLPEYLELRRAREARIAAAEAERLRREREEDEAYARRREESEREEYARLKAKFEGSAAPAAGEGE